MWNAETINLIVKLFPVIVQSVVLVEKLVTGKTGKAKQDAAIEGVKVAVQTTELVTRKDIFNDPEVEAAVRCGIDAVVAGLNSVNKEPATLQ